MVDGTAKLLSSSWLVPGRLTALIISTEEREALQQLALRLADKELPAGWEMVQSSAYARVASNPGRGIYYKEFLPRSPLESVKALARGSRATRARKQGDALLWAGFEAPANLAWGRLSGGREYLFTGAARGQDVTSWLQTRLASRAGEALATRRQLLRDLGVHIGRLHATGFIHGDLRPGNVLADLCQGRFLFTLIDNERTVQRLPPPGRMLLRNLMQLNMLPLATLSRADRMRFFRGWQRQMRYLSPIEARLLAREAYQWAARRMTEKAQR
jgi:hypothetical protein